MSKTYLTVSMQQASQQLAQRIKLGYEIIKQPTPSSIDNKFIAEFRNSSKKWNDYNSTFLKKIFTDESVANKYDSVTANMKYHSVGERLNVNANLCLLKIHELESIKERLSLYKKSFTTSIDATSTKYVGSKIFIVHGHDEAVKQSVARFLEKLDLEVIILHEQADKGKTIIEKLETNSTLVDIGYAVILLTPDDIATTKKHKDDPNLKSLLQERARQNVVFELGYFMARLGRTKVRAIYVDGVELPSDYQGILYTKYDASESWKLELAREIKASGIDIDLNKIL